jgi:hypothetical protein
MATPNVNTTKRISLTLNGESEPGFASTSIGTVGQREFAAMSFRNLTAENEADPRSTLLGRKEGNEKIRRLWEARTIINNPYFEL